jgi:hypothetical protein
VTNMTPISAIVVDVDHLGNEYFIAVQVGCDHSVGAFDKLSFGENRPRLGFYRHGWLDLVYDRKFDLRAGDPFPLWSIS